MADIRKTVGCAGILVSDTFCGPMKELPKEGQLLAVDALPTKAGGCAANVAIDLGKQGIAVEIAGCLGNDASARVLLASLEEHGVGCSRIVYSNALSTSKTVILLVEGQDRRYIHSFGANAGFTVRDINREWVRKLGVFYLGGLFLMPAFDVDEVRDLLRDCRRHGVVTVVDVVIPQNFNLPSDLGPLLREVDYFLPNNDEACCMTGASDPLVQLRTLLDWGAQTVMITCGRHGVLAGKAGRFWKAGIYPGIIQVDPSGSGDAFAAGVVTGVVRGWDVPKILRYASALGASAIQALGTTDGVFTVVEAEAFLSRYSLDITEGLL
jgi:sugar/nucleoside kinase (ribokinase family)